ncbi:hypothetical protein [Streptomyces sp. SM12]|uniref:hypothetical protein n=1 Tax=Streptomyces sp. SM12 TaxID=1071602 RepID=UPI000CD54247|nr:hypothetical protein [Streptomyces sp. SM12]
MSAREEVVEIVRRICPPHLDAEFYGQRVNGLLDKFGHELAEQIRDDAHRQAHFGPGPGSARSRLRAAPFHAANLIDPEVYQ